MPRTVRKAHGQAFLERVRVMQASFQEERSKQLSDAAFLGEPEEEDDECPDAEDDYMQRYMHEWRACIRRTRSHTTARARGPTGQPPAAESKEVPVAQLLRRINAAPAREPWKVLLLPHAHVSRKNVRKNFRVLSLRMHPDKIDDPTLKDAATSAFVKLKAAYDSLLSG